MIQKKTIFDYLTQVMIIWSVSVLSLCLFCGLLGESTKELSSMFALGSAGLPLSTLLQFLGLSVTISSFMWLFMTDLVIKNLNITLRLILLFSSIIIAVGIFAGVFAWFPINQIKPWIMFFISFAVCATTSISISVIRAKRADDKMQAALERLKGEEW